MIVMLKSTFLTAKINFRIIVGIRIMCVTMYQIVQERINECNAL